MKIITNIQLRAARQVLNTGIRDIAKLLNVSKATISKAELGKTRDFFFKHRVLTTFLRKCNIRENSILQKACRALDLQFS